MSQSPARRKRQIMADASRTNVAAIAIAGANVPAKVTAVTSRILRITIGHRVDGAVTSYLPAEPWPQAAAAGCIQNDRLETASVSASLGEASSGETGVLVFADKAGRALLRLLP